MMLKGTMFSQGSAMAEPGQVKHEPHTGLASLQMQLTQLPRFMLFTAYTQLASGRHAPITLLDPTVHHLPTQTKLCCTYACRVPQSMVLRVKLHLMFMAASSVAR